MGRMTKRANGLIHRGFGVLIGKNSAVKLVNNHAALAPTEASDRFCKPAQSQDIYGESSQPHPVGS